LINRWCIITFGGYVPEYVCCADSTSLYYYDITVIKLLLKCVYCIICFPLDSFCPDNNRRTVVSLIIIHKHQTVFIAMNNKLCAYSINKRFYQFCPQFFFSYCAFTTIDNTAAGTFSFVELIYEDRPPAVVRPNLSTFFLWWFTRWI